MLASHESFQGIVDARWGNSFAGDPMVKVWNKLKALKPDLKQLNTNCYANISDQVVKAREDLAAVQRQLQHDRVNLCLLYNLTLPTNLVV